MAGTGQALPFPTPKAGRRVRKHKPTGTADRRQRGAVPPPSERPCPRHRLARWPEGPRWPPGANTAARPCSMGPPSQAPQGRAGPPPPGLQEGSFQKGSPRSHNAPWRAQAQDLESTRGPWGLQARKRRPVQPFVGQLQGTRALHWRRWRQAGDSMVAVFPAPPTRGPTRPDIRSFLHSVIHPLSHRASTERPGPGAPL